MLAIVDKPMQQTTYTQVALRAQASWSPVKRLTLSRLVQTAVSRAVEVVSQKEVTIARAVEVTVPVVTDVAATRVVVQVVMKPVQVTKQVEVPIVTSMAVNVSTNVTMTKEVPITRVITKLENITQMEAITEVINITRYACRRHAPPEPPVVIVRLQARAPAVDSLCTGFRSRSGRPMCTFCWTARARCCATIPPARTRWRIGTVRSKPRLRSSSRWRRT
jgi:hypothetical protein